MKKFKQNEYTVNICTDIEEWGKEFYGMPENSELENRLELESECMGFSCIEDKEVWMFVPKKFDDDELAETIAHELGHIIVPEFVFNPEQIDGNEQMHEDKAEFYENFYILVRSILKKIKTIIEHE